MKRVLIVDDSLELGRWLKTALLQMNPNLQATVFPSGEEALLEGARHPVDVLVTDIRLAGMSGLELVRKIRKRHPTIRIIVITGVPDRGLERQAKELGIDGFFRKPMDIPSFLDAVSACLKEEEVKQPSETVEDTQPTPARNEAVAEPATTPLPAEGLSSILSGLRQTLGALAVLLLDPQGNLVARSGHFPDSKFEDRWAQVLSEMARSSLQVSRLLETTQARNLAAFQGLAFDLVLSPVGDHSLVLALRSGRPTLRLGLAFEEILNVQKEILAWISTRGKKGPAAQEVQAQVEPAQVTEASAPQEAAQPVEPAPEEVYQPIPGVDTAVLPELNPDAPPSDEFVAIFGKPEALKSEDVDAFWESAVEANTLLEANPDVISYEQARKMGLAPEDEE